ncbi:MAG TPA: hypothetical protein VJT83_07505, partial [Chitinophagaceae bacterium]|nr:hypothetical protein [Chitinophagaceae bacterium]
LFRLFMMVNHSNYFAALGFKKLYDPEMRDFEKDDIEDAIREIVTTWRSKYPRLDFNVETLRFDSLLNFSYSFTRELTNLKFE